MAIHPIDDDTPDLPEGYDLEPRDLYRKHGFGAGRMFQETGEWLSAHEYLVVDAGDLLAAVVDAHVLPRLDPDPLVEQIGGSRNRLRAISPGGDLLGRSQAPQSWPEVVLVRREDVLDLARDLADPACAPDLTDWAERWSVDAA